MNRTTSTTQQEVPGGHAGGNTNTCAEEATTGAFLAICKRVLKRDDVALDRSFYELGGDSFTFILYVSAVQQAFGGRMTTEALLACRTLDEARRLILCRSAAGSAPPDGADPMLDAPRAPAVAGDSGGRAALEQVVTARQGLVSGSIETPANRYSLLHLKRRNLEHWHVTTTLELVEAVDRAALERAVDDLIRHHDGLRLQVLTQEPDWRECIVDPVPHRYLSVQEYCGSDDGDGWRTFVEASLKELCQTLRFPGELFKVRCIEHAHTHTSLLALVAHHLLVDAHAWSIVQQDLLRLYTDHRAGRQPLLPPKTTSLIDYAHALPRYWTLQAERELKHWTSLPWQKLKPSLDGLSVSDERNIEKYTVNIVRTLAVGDPAEYVSRFARMGGYTFVEVVLTSIASAFHRWTGHEILHISTAFHGREAVIPGMDLTRTVGWISETVPLLLPAAGPLGSALEETHRQVERANVYGKSYGVLRHLIADSPARRELEAHPRAPLSINIRLPRVKWTSEAARRTAQFRLPQPDTPATQRVCLLSGGVYFDADKLHISWDFSTELFPVDRIAAFADGCMQQLAESTRVLLPEADS